MTDKDKKWRKIQIPQTHMDIHAGEDKKVAVTYTAGAKDNEYYVQKVSVTDTTSGTTTITDPNVLVASGDMLTFDNFKMDLGLSRKNMVPVLSERDLKTLEDYLKKQLAELPEDDDEWHGYHMAIQDILEYLKGEDVDVED